MPIFWIVSEIVAYGIFIQKYGISAAILVGIVTLAVGLMAFRRLGMGIASITGNNAASPELIFKTVKKIGWAALGAFLLIIPGFISNVAGIVMLLLNPAAWLTGKANQPVQDDAIIDLEPADWNVESQPDTNQQGDKSNQPDQRKIG